jgi:hypothetical protein
MATEMTEITDEDVALEHLGLKTPEAVPTAEEPTQPAPVLQPEPEPEPEPEPTPAPKPAPSEDIEAKLKDAEEKRRSFQAEADYEKARNRVLNDRVAALEAQLQRPATPQEKEELKADFITDGYFDTEKFNAYQTRLAAKIKEEAKQEALKEFSRAQNNIEQEKQIAELIKVRPDLKDPYTGKADIARILAEAEAKTKNVKLVDILGPAPRDAKTIDAIARNADKPQSVVQAQETATEPKPEPEEIATLRKTGAFSEEELAELKSTY